MTKIRNFHKTIFEIFDKEGLKYDKEQLGEQLNKAICEWEGSFIAEFFEPYEIQGEVLYCVMKQHDYIAVQFFTKTTLKQDQYISFRVFDDSIRWVFNYAKIETSLKDSHFIRVCEDYIEGKF